MNLNASITSYVPIAGAAGDGTIVRGSDVMPSGRLIAVNYTDLDTVQVARLSSLGIKASARIMVHAAAIRGIGGTVRLGDNLTIKSPPFPAAPRVYSVVGISTRIGGAQGVPDVLVLDLLEVQSGN